MRLLIHHCSCCGTGGARLNWVAIVGCCRYVAPSCLVRYSCPPGYGGGDCAALGYCSVVIFVDPLRGVAPQALRVDPLRGGGAPGTNGGPAGGGGAPGTKGGPAERGAPQGLRMDPLRRGGRPRH